MTSIETIIGQNNMSSTNEMFVKNKHLYGKSLINEAYETNYPKYSLYEYSDEPVRHAFFNTSNLRYISNTITKKLQGVHPEGKKIIVPDQEILKMMTNVSLNNYNDINLMNDMVVNIIVDYIKDEFEMTAENNKLNIWVTQYTPDTTLRRNSEIKIRNKHPTRMVFNMNY